MEQNDKKREKVDKKLRDFIAILDRRDFCAKGFCDCVIFTLRDFRQRSNGLAG
jgi:hypothetical protein